MKTQKIESFLRPLCTRRSSLMMALAGLAAAAPLAMAQAGRQWVSLDPAVGEGVGPTATVNPASTKDHTILDISIPGFYVENVVDPVNGVFQKLTIPPSTATMGLLLPAIQKVRGAAAVPVINMLVALPSDASTCTIGSLTPTSTTTLANLRVVPAQPDTMEEESIDPANQPPFEYNAGAYASNTPYPSDNGGAIGPVGKKVGIRLQPMSVKPFKYVPSTGQMVVNSKFSVVIDHPGSPLPQTREHILLARQVGTACVNYDTPAAPWITEHIDYKGAFLFITKDDVLDDLRPLVQQKQRRGYTTRVATQDDVDTNHNGTMEATEVRSYIKGWYDDHDNESLKYVVLVGDVNRIPNAADPFYGYPSDYYYSCYENDDFYADMGLGRITFNAGQLPDIISRIMAYEEAPPASADYYSSSLAIGHQQVDANFVKVLDEAVSIPFPASEPMNFTKAYGTNAFTGTNLTVWNALNDGQHIVYYRGHGSPNTFYEWSYNGDNFEDNYLNWYNLPSHPSWCPIVISSACANGALASSDCILEDWFQRPGNGAVAAYGGLIGSRRDMNHGFTTMFWKYLRTFGKTGTMFSHCEWSQIMGYLQQWSPDMTDPAKNIWTYTLLGDPEMKIWAKKPSIAKPESLPGSTTSGAQTLDITVKNGHGDPVPGAVVSAFKDGEVQKTVYADASGHASLLVNPQSYGVMTVRTYTYDDGTQESESNIVVGVCPADADGSGFVDTDDFDFFVKQFEAGAQGADFDQSGFVDTDDFDAFVHAFERGC